ncbi:MAG: hypothetical protein ABWY18_02445 [Tardiphaga sp.]
MALALLVAGLPVAHAMPDAPAMPGAGMMHDHHDGMAMDAMSDADDGDPSAPTAPCKCLNCSMCVTSATVSPVRLADPERRVAAVIYRSDATGIAGIAGHVEPGIPILGL